MNVERQPGSLSGLSDDALGSIAVSLVVNEVQWTPDVAPAVLDRIARDAVTYPDQFDRRPAPPTVPGESGAGERSPRRTVGRLAVFAVLLAIVAVAVAIAANTGSVRGAIPDLGALHPELVGVRLYRDTCNGGIRGADEAGMPDGSTTLAELVRMAGMFVSFGLDDDGEVNAVDPGGSILYERSVAAA